MGPKTSEKSKSAVDEGGGGEEEGDEEGMVSFVRLATRRECMFL